MKLRPTGFVIVSRVFCGEGSLYRVERLEVSYLSAKPCVWNILRVSHLESRFCEDQNRFRTQKLFEINILAKVIGKNPRSRYCQTTAKTIANFFVRNILRVSHVESRFCRA